MDYKDLANLIFPDVKPIEYYEEKYPRRLHQVQQDLYILEVYTKL